MKVTASPYLNEYLGTCTRHMPGAGGQIRTQTCILLSRVAAYLMSINPDRVKAQGNEDGAKFLIAKQNEWADALHDYEELGVAVNLNHHRVQGAKVNALIRAVALRGKTENQTDRTLMGHLVARLASDIGLPYQPELPGV